MKSIGEIETRVSEISVGVGTLLSEQEGPFENDKLSRC